MAHGLNSVLKRGVASVNCRNEGGKGVGSRRIFAPHFKLQVLDSYRNDTDCKGNQRATARKYGIHRRQIQKWLQVETTLRNSVSNVKEKIMVAEKSLNCDSNRKSCNNDFEMALNDRRQQDDESASLASGIEARVPALTRSPSAASYSSPPLPLDYTIHGRVYTASPIVARVEPPLAPQFPSSPIDLSVKRPNSIATASAPVCCVPPSPLMPFTPVTPEPHPDVWDLSTKRKCLSPVQTPIQTPPASQNASKPIKLFKPYLDDINEPEEPTLTKLEPYCPVAVVPSNESYYYNNNNICEVKSEYTNTYTLHELQPNFYHSPYPEYEVGVYCYEDISYGQSLTPIKQRQSYSLDFKLSAIDCYYQDSICKGNQRAVATKYNIHRRQVQKWLKQAEELRLRNESIKQLHAVR